MSLFVASPQNIPKDGMACYSIGYLSAICESDCFFSACLDFLSIFEHENAFNHMEFNSRHT